MSEQIEIGDVVKHGPTGETWVVCRVGGDSVYPAGWPPSCGEIKDCTLVRKATADEKADIIKQCMGLPASDARHIRVAWEAEK